MKTAAAPPRGQPKTAGSDKGEPQPNPAVDVGDHVYVRHKGAPCTALVLAHGKHGMTCRIDGAQHQLLWDAYLGHKKRPMQSYSIVDQGEDGMIVEDANKRRRYIGTPDEAKEDPMIVKAQRPIILFAKAAGMPPGPGLSKKTLTDRNGVQTTRWVRTSAGMPPPQRGQHIGYEIGEHRGHGKVTAVGSKGVTVRDAKNGKHQPEHGQITHHWTGEGEPDGSPHDQHREPELPAYAPRNEGEDDKTYAKRAVDTGPDVTHLPEDHDRYFNTAGAKHVPLANLHSTKSEAENQQGGDNGPKRMQAAWHGKLGKRDPITVMPHKDKAGHYEVVDGNGTLTSAQKLGWRGLPTKEVSREEGEMMQTADKLKEAKKQLPSKKPFFDKAEVDALPDPKKHRHTAFASWDEAIAKAPEAKAQFEGILDKLGKSLGFERGEGSPDDLTDKQVDSDKAYMFMGPIKTQEKSTKKVNTDYDGDWGGLKDLVRATVAVRSVSDVHAMIAGLKEQGVQLAQKPKDNMTHGTDDGYRDINLILTMPNGLPAELQLQVKAITRAKSKAHTFYNDNIALEQMPENRDAKGDKKPFHEWSPKHRQAFAHNRNAMHKIYDPVWAEVLRKEDAGEQLGGPKTMHKALQRRMIYIVKRGNHHEIR